MWLPGRSPTWFRSRKNKLQVRQQIPFGDDNKKSNGKSKDEIQGSFTAFRMTTKTDNDKKRATTTTKTDNDKGKNRQRQKQATAKTGNDKNNSKEQTRAKAKNKRGFPDAAR